MSDKSDPVEYCTIQAQVVDDGRDPGRSGQKIMWLQFLAQGQNDKGNYLVGRSEKIPLANMIGAASYSPRKSDVSHNSTLQNFVLKLQKKGWQLESGTAGEWWQKRLKRVAPPKQTFLDKVKSKLGAS